MLQRQIVENYTHTSLAIMIAVRLWSIISGEVCEGRFRKYNTFRLLQ